MRKLHLFIIILMVVVGIVLSAYISLKFYDKETESILSHFRKDVDEQVYMLDKQIGLNLEVLHSLKSLYDASEEVTFYEFKEAAQAILVRHREVHALEWIPRVPQARRKKYEQVLRRYYPDFQITEKDVENQFVKAQERAEYFPVYFVEPYIGNERALGFDLASNAKRLKALNQARESGRFVATQSIDLVQEASNSKGFLIFVPIYEKSLNNANKNLFGFVLGVFKIDQIFKNTFNEFALHKTKFRLQDITTSDRGEIIIKHDAEAVQHKYYPYEYRKKMFPIAGRQWAIYASPTQDYVDQQRSFYPMFIFVFGVFFVLAGASYSYLILRRNFVVEALVQKRTASLQLLRAISELSNETKNDHDFLAKSIHLICESMRWPVGHVYLRQDKLLIPSKIWYISKGADFKTFKEVTMKTTFAMGIGLPGRVLKTAEPHWIDDVTKDANYPRAKLADNIGVKTGLGIPVVINNQIEMVLEFYSADMIKSDENILTTMLNIGSLIGRIAEKQKSERIILDQTFALDQHAIVAITDTKGKITYVNDKFCEVSKYSRNELIGKTHAIVNSGYHSKEFIGDLWRTIGQGHVWKNVIRNKAKDGTCYWVDTTIVPFLDENKKPYQYLAIRTDVTRQRESERIIHKKSSELQKSNLELHAAKGKLEELSKNLEDEVKRKTEELIQANERLVRHEKLAAMGKLAGIIGHELRGPLGVILNSMYFIKLRLKQSTDEKIRKHLKIVEEEISTANTIIEDTLDFARKKAPIFETANVIPLIDQALSRKRIPANINVTCTKSDDISLVRVDAEQFQRVLYNLIQNAVQSMPHGGDLTISAEMSNHGSNDHVIISIQDTGEGISRKDQKKIFEPLYTTKIKGTGLGLSVCRTIIKAHHGTLDFESQEGQGTIFKIQLPTQG